MVHGKSASYLHIHHKDLSNQLRSLRHTLDDQVGPQDGHAADTDTGLSGSIGGTEAGEHDSGGATQRAKEGLLTTKTTIRDDFPKT